jgi:hypothetical protein
LEEIAQGVLRCSPYAELRHVVCSLRDDVLRLDGEVPTYFHKQMAQAWLLSRVKGCPLVENRLRVKECRSAVVTRSGRRTALGATFLV